MAERTKATVSKTVESHWGSVGSNPTLSAHKPGKLARLRGSEGFELFFCLVVGLTVLLRVGIVCVTGVGEVQIPLSPRTPVSPPACGGKVPPAKPG